MNWTLSIGSIAAGPPGSDVTVTNVGTSPDAAVLDIKIPRGAQGTGVGDFPEEVAVPFSTNIQLDLDNGQAAFRVAPLTGPVYLETPLGLAEGKTGYIVLQQDSTGGRNIWFSEDWLFPDGDTVFTDTPNAIDIVTYAVDSNGKLLAAKALNYAPAEQPAVWETTHLPQIVLDLDANYGVSATGSSVDSWASRVGTVEATSAGSSRPTLNTSYNGTKAIVADGVDDYMTVPFTEVPDGWSIFVLAGNQDDDGTPLLAVSEGISTVFRFYGVFDCFTINSVTGAPQGTIRTAAASTVPALYGVDSNGVGIGYVNGAVNTHTAGKSGSAGIGDGATPLLLFAGHGPDFLGISLIRLIIVDGPLTTENRQRIEGRMMHDAGLEHLLPLSHPYRYSGPVNL